MHRIDTDGHIAGTWSDGDPSTGVQGTTMSMDWLNDMQGNLVDVVESAGIELEKGDLTQLRLAISAMIAGAQVNWNVAIAAAKAEAIAAARVKPGVIEMFGSAAAPVGYLKCDGAAVSRAAFPDLFAVIGTIHGPGDGATTFNVPDMRGEFARGWDDGRGVDVARAFGSTQADELKSHLHAVSPPSATDDTAAGLTTAGSGGAELINPYNTGLTGGPETRPRNVALLFIIKT